MKNEMKCLGGTETGRKKNVSVWAQKLGDRKLQTYNFSQIHFLFFFFFKTIFLSEHDLLFGPDLILDP